MSPFSLATEHRNLAFAAVSLLLVANLWHPAPLAAQSAPTESVNREILLPVYLHDTMIGEVAVFVDLETSTIQGVSTSIITLLEPHIRPGTLADLDSSTAKGDGARPDCCIDPGQLETAGLPLEFDPSAAVLRLVPARGTEQPRSVSLHERSTRSVDGIFPSSRVSAYWNINSSLEYIHRADPQSQVDLPRHQIPLQAASDASLTLDISDRAGLMNLYASGILETADIAHDSDSTTPELESAALRWDIPGSLLSIEAGSLTLPQEGMLRSIPMYGLGLSRDSSLQPQQISRSLGSTELHLDRPSRVAVLVNGRRVDQLELPAGSHDIQDIPVPSGISRVNLNITDDMQRERSVTIHLSRTPGLLPVGAVRYAIGGGAHQDDTGHLQAAGYISYGASAALTATAAAAGSPDELLVSTAGILAAPFGSLLLEAGGYARFFPDDSPEGAENDTTSDLDAAVKLEYQLQRPYQDDFPRFSAGAQLTGPHLRHPSPQDPRQNREAVRLYSSIGQNIGELANMTVGVRGSLNRAPDPASARFSVILQRRLGRGVNILMRSSLELSEDSPPLPRVQLSYTYSPGANAEQPAAAISQDIIENRTAIRVGGTLHEQPGRRVSGSASVQNISLQDPAPEYRPAQAAASLRWFTPILEGSLRSGLRRSGGNAQPELSVELQHGSGIVFADGAVSFSRPVRDAFVIAEPHPQFADVDVRLASERGNSGTGIYPWGTGIISGLKSYNLFTLYPDAPELPDGYTFSTHRYHIRPGFRQGTRITLGSAATVTLRATLTNSNGNPLPLQTGRIFTAGDAAAAPLPEEGERFFSNRSGIVEIYGLAPGIYTIVLNDGRSSEVQIPESAAGTYSLDAVEFE